MILTIPGLWNSGPEHWQSYWERALPGCRRVEQVEWVAPRCEHWTAGIDAAVAAAIPPVVLAAHSLGCATVVRWAKRYKRAIAGALLVAPSDVEGPDYPKEPQGFGPMPLDRLPFPSIVVASEDDPWVSFARAQYFSGCWGSEFVNIGPAGHINSDSKLGDWPQGQALLRRLLQHELRGTTA